jgi:hypothetical protein
LTIFNFEQTWILSTTAERKTTTKRNGRGPPKEMEDDLKKMEDNLKKNGRQPKKTK